MKRLVGGSLVLVACASSIALAGPKAKKKPLPEPEPAPAPLPAAPEPEPPPPPPPPAESKPWAEGVPKETQDQATALYDEGNQLFAQQQHAPAAAKYKEALALWDHPLIRFNLAVTEIRLDRMLEAADDLERSLRYGNKPFKPADLYDQAINYQAVLKGRVGTVEASCTQAGARLRLDGKPWLDCPGTKKERVLVGEHAIVGEKQGFLTKSEKIVVEGGETESRKVTLVSADSAVVYKYRFRRWIPWVTVGAGIGVALAGAATWNAGQNQLDEFHADYRIVCADGCEPGLTDPSHRALADELDSAELKGAVGIGVMAAGGAILATGIVLVVLNRPTREMPTVDVAPRDGGGVATVGWHF